MKPINSVNQINYLEGPLNIPEIIGDVIKRQLPKEAFFILNIDDIVFKYQQWIKLFPRVIPHYAVKCNENDLVLRVLADLGTGFDCASKGEIERILALGVSADRIVFANPTKSIDHIDCAFANGIARMTFDNEDELIKIKQYYPGAELILRIRCDAENSLVKLGKKFGSDPFAEAENLLIIAKQLELTVIGISFHVGSGCDDYPIYAKAISLSKRLFSFAKTLGHQMSLLDIGGGFPGDNMSNVREIAEIVNSSIQTHFNGMDLRIIAEPGRYFVSSAFTLASQIHSRKLITNTTSKEIEYAMYYMNGGIFNSLLGMKIDNDIIRPQLLEEGNDSVEDGVLVSSTIWGPTCDVYDQMCENVRLPLQSIGNWIIFPSTGAYTISLTTHFNGFPAPDVYAFASKQMRNNNLRVH